MTTVIFRLLLLLAAFQPLWAEDKTAKLPFVPNLPVELTSRITVDVAQSLPGLSLSTKGSQDLKAELVLPADHSAIPLTKPPLDLLVCVKYLKIFLKANDEELVFESGNTDSSLYATQVNKLMDCPLRFRFNERLQLDTGVNEWKQALHLLPIFRDIQPEAIVIDLFFHLFALGGVSLQEGTVIEREIAGVAIPSLPTKITYTVTKIDDYKVFAAIKGQIEKKTFTLSGKVLTDKDSEELVHVSLQGAMEGEGKWNRDNALLYDLTLHYNYAAMFKLAELEWMMNIDLEVHNHTRLKGSL